MRKLITVFFALAVTTASTLLLARPIRDDMAGRCTSFPAENEIVPIDYIESTGTQYLNLLFKKSDVPDIVIEVRFSNCPFVSSYSYYNGLIGWCESSNGNTTGLKVASNGILLSDGRNAAGATVVEMTPPVDIVANLSSNGAKINGVEVPTYTMSIRYNAEEFPLGLFCFSASTDGLPKGYANGRGIGRGRCHYLRVYSGDTLVHNFQPVRIGSIGYMLDTVNGTLFPNQGTGSFVLGSDL